MKKGLEALTALALMAVFVVGCPEASTTSTVTPTGENVNFRFLISDEASAIGDFQHLNVTISSIGLHHAASGNWTELSVNKTVDLTELQGDNAQEIWSGNLTTGNYTKVFIYVSNITAIPNEGNETVEVKLPANNRLMISKPFVVTTDNVTLFVYDVTVVRAGNSAKYILKPQVNQSGANQPFVLV